MLLFCKNLIIKMLSLPLLFLIVVSAPCCKRVTAITLCPLNWREKKNRNKVLHWELSLKAGRGGLQSTWPPATFFGKYCRRKMKPKKSLAVWFTTYLLYLLSITWNHSDNFEYWGIWHSLFAITRFWDIKVLFLRIISPLLR